MERLTNAHEFLDGPLGEPAALDGHLRDLRRINRWLGGSRLSAAALDALTAHRAELTVLDVWTAGADLPAALARRARTRGRRLHVVGIDSRPDVLAAAVRLLGGTNGADVELHVGDGRNLRFADRSFDVAHASLALHHLEPAVAVDVLREMGRVARLGVVVNDLDRTRVGWVGAWLAGHLLTANRYTRHDAPLSVRRAYRPQEAAAMLYAAGLRPVRVVRGRFAQRYAIAAVPAGDRSDPIGAGG
ncbi:MAG: methyltransferase domain-containing protein [Chloroflexi bacterium]|nr:methyltransferase domain-containing protein [Chloroflexota bacterium]